jgi:hypothetical protein
MQKKKVLKASVQPTITGFFERNPIPSQNALEPKPIFSTSGPQTELKRKDFHSEAEESLVIPSSKEDAAFSSRNTRKRVKINGFEEPERKNLTGDLFNLL